MNHKQKYFSSSVRQFRLLTWKSGRWPKGKWWLFNSFWSVSLSSCSGLWWCLYLSSTRLGRFSELWIFWKADCSLNKAEYLCGDVCVVGERVRESPLCPHVSKGQKTVCTSLQQCKYLSACSTLAGCLTVQNCSDLGDQTQSRCCRRSCCGVELN